MKLNKKHQICALLLVGFGFIKPVYADNLGRLFTTPAERIALEKVRNAKPKLEKRPLVDMIDVNDMVEPETAKKEPVLVNAITVKGIVQRSDGKNSAWLNDSNTYEGDLESQYLNINNNEISEDHVQITMPDQKTKIKLKVGDNYNPVNQEGY